MRLPFWVAAGPVSESKENEREAVMFAVPVVGTNVAVPATDAAARRCMPRSLQRTDAVRRRVLIGTATILGTAALPRLSMLASAQPPEPPTQSGMPALGPILSQPGWSKWIEAGQIAPLREGEVALLKSIPAAPVFGEAAEDRAQRVVADVRAAQSDAQPAYVAAFLAFAGLQNTNVFKQWHQRSYAPYEERREYPSQDDPYIWGQGKIPVSAAWANVEIGYALERLQLSGARIVSNLRAWRRLLSMRGTNTRKS